MSINSYTDTIAAIATPLAQGAISIIRISGEDAIAIANKIFDKDLSKKKSHTISYGFIMDQDKPVDEVLVSVFRAPKTYTREDIVEINCHGGPFVTRKVLELVLTAGARLAAPGEFTQRAFLNGRIDLSQAEAVEEMIEASNDNAARMAIWQIRGSVKELMEPLIDDLMDLIANIEVNIDYPEYDDVEQLTFETLLPASKNLLNRMEQILETSSQGQMYKDGIDTVILGKPNVGKSSLLNALLEEDKAIVTDIAGTTRDIVEGQIHLGPLQLNLIDTAGIRDSADAIEQIGIQKSLETLEKARLVLLVLDGSKPLDDQDQQLIEAARKKDHIILLNKADLFSSQPNEVSLAPSAQNSAEKKTEPSASGSSLSGFPEEAIVIAAGKHQVQPLLDELKKRYDAGQIPQNSMISTQRQIGLLKNAREDMMRAIEAMEMETEPDLIEIDLTAAHNHLKEILGEVSQDDLLDTLFSNFCLGK